MRFGLIGSGMMGVEHLRNLRLHDDATIAALADPVARSRGWGVDSAACDVDVYEDYRDMLAKTELDAVIVSTPNHTHAEVLDDVFRTGLHVLVEKPLCTTLEDCRAITEAAESHPGLVWVGMEYRYMPPVARLVEEVKGGAVGTLRMLAIREHRYPFLPKVGDWNRFNRNTGGTLVEKCCHYFDLMRLIVGARPARIYASGAQDVNHLDERYDGEAPDILDNAYVVVDFDGGCRALLDLCMFAEGSRNAEEIAATGDAGKVESFIPSSKVVIGRRNPRHVETLKVEIDKDVLEAGFHHGATYYQQRAFIDAARDGAPPVVSVEDGLWAVAMGVAAQQSIEEGRPVELAELGL